MNLQRIRYYLTFCETMHFTRAASRLKISQPALTKALKHLEADVGATLIRREGKHTHLTKVGRQVYEKYRELMDAASAIEKDVQTITGRSTRHLSLAVVRHLNFKLLAGFVREFHGKHPDIQLNIIDCNQNEGEVLLSSGHVDCLVGVESSSVRNRFACLELYSESVGLLCHCPDFEAGNNAMDVEGVDSLFAQENTGKLFSNKRPDKRYAIQCTQQLWVQELVRLGIGSMPVMVGSATINDVMVIPSVCPETTVQVVAAFPFGRNDCKTLVAFKRNLEIYPFVCSGHAAVP